MVKVRHPAWCEREHGSPLHHATITTVPTDDLTFIEVSLSQDNDQAPTVVVTLVCGLEDIVTDLTVAHARTIRDALSAAIEAVAA